MGSLKAGVRRRASRGLAERPFLLFAALLLLPALGFGWLGARSLQREIAAHRREAAGETHDVVRRTIDRVARDLQELAQRESERPYTMYQLEYAPEETVFKQLDFQPSPLRKPPDDPRVLGWFQWELGAKGVFDRPETFGSDGTPWRDAFTATYGPALQRRLAEAPGTFDAATARRVDLALRVVQANEERGKLIEEIQIAQNEAEELEPVATQERAGQTASTQYLESFRARASDAPVPIRYGRFRHLARREGQPGPPLVAWRIVWIPDVYASQREVSRDRWLLQGYALDPGVAFPQEWESVGSTRMIRADRAGAARDRPGAREASLVDTMDAELLAAPNLPPHGAPRLALVAVPDLEALSVFARDARTRFAWLLLGVLAVVTVGMFVLTRGLRREVALARRKEDFLAAVTHELKTPLAGIRMHADMLREGWVADADACERYAGRILEETDRLGHLVDQVLDLAALERGVARAHAEPGDLAASVRDAVQMLEPAAAEAGARLVLDRPEDLPPVRFDPRLVRPLVMNLVDNAIKYGVRGDATAVRISLSRVEGAVVLQVADDGPGVDRVILRRPFDPFLRAGDELTRERPGIGIGLALVKRYAEAHDADVALESAPGKGTRVRVRFPA